MSAYVAGRTFGGSEAGGEALVLKFAPGGSLLRQKRWGSALNEVATGVAVGPGGEVYVTGGVTDPDDGSP